MTPAAEEKIGFWSARPVLRDRLAMLLAGGLTTALMIAAFPRHGVPEAAYVAFLPLLLWLLYVRPAFRAVRRIGFAIGFVQWIVLLWWLRHFPEQVGISPAWGYLGLVLLSAVLAFFWVAWAWLAAFVLERLGGVKTALGWRLVAMAGLAGAWVMLEWTREWIFSGFPWLPLAASQWDRPLLLQMISITGAWGLSFLLVFFNLGLAFYVRQLLRAERKVWYKRFCVEFYAGLLGVFVAIGSGVDDLQKRPDRPAFRAAFVQPYIKPPERWDKDGKAALITRYDEWLRQPMAIVNELREAGAADRDWLAEITPDVVLWPEASTPYPAPGDPKTVGWLEGIAKDIGIPILMGNLAAERNAEGEALWYNAVIAIDPEKGLDDHFVAKRELVPFGEAVPAWLPFVDRLIPLEGSFEPGSGDPILRVRIGGKAWRVAPLICYEDLFPSISRKAVAEGADFILVVTNDAWYGEESAPFQHMVHSILRAVETRRPVLRVGNAGWSGWIDERGYLRFEFGDPETGSIFTADTAVREIARTAAFMGTETVYVRWGDWFVALSALLVGGCLAACFWRVPETRTAGRKER